MPSQKIKFKNSFCLLFIIFILAFLIFNLVLPNSQSFAQLSPREEREILEEELKKLEEEIAQLEKDITATQKEKDTLANKVAILKNQIKKLDLQIYQSEVMVKDLNLQIEDTQSSIEKTSLKIENSKERLSQILRTIYEEDQKSVIEILLSVAKLSDFFDNLMTLETLNLKNQQFLDEIKNLKSSLEKQEEVLDSERDDLEKLLKIQQLQKQENEATKKQQEYLLEKTKGKESEYQKLLTETKKRAQEIRARIFELIGIPEAPTFGEAYELAKYVEGITGIRPALLLAVLTQESNIGKNVGQCYLVNLTTGEGIRIQTGKKEPRTMNPTRDIPYFLQITKELDRDPFNTPVSCPMSYGWGGAMGPAQFIPSTWMRYRERIKAITGSAADPWNIKDSFVAAALYLADYGASSQDPNGEWKAAMIYFSGTTSSKYRFYGDSVIRIASQYEQDIREIERLASLF